MVASFFANPFVLTIVVGAAIGLAIYEYFEQEKRRQAPCRHNSRPDYSSNERGRPGNSPGPIPPNRKLGHSTSRHKNVDSTSQKRNGNTIPIVSNNSCRIQSFHSDEHGGASSTSKKQQVQNTIASTSTKQQVLDNKTVNSDTIRNSLYEEKNYEKDVCNKMRNDVNQNLDDENKTFLKKVDKSTLLKDIEIKELNTSISDCSSSSSVERNQMVDPETDSKHSLYNICEKEQNADVGHCSSSSVDKNQMVDFESNSKYLYNICEKERNAAINMSEESDENEPVKDSEKLLVYTKEVFDKMKSDVKNITEGHFIEEDNNNAGCGTTVEDQELEIKVLDLEICAEKEQNSEPCTENSLMNTSCTPSKTLCMGCTEKPINAVNDPCQHSSFCMECAGKVFKIYEYCTVCRSEIVSFHNA